VRADDIGVHARQMVIDVVLLRVGIALGGVSWSRLGSQVNVLVRPCTAAVSVQALRSLGQHCPLLLMPSIL